MKIEEAIRQESFQNPHHRAGMNLLFTANWLSNKIALVLKPVDLSLQQLNALSILDGQPNKTASVNLIRDRMIDRMPNVSRLINKLMEKGLITKERNASDQRVVYVRLTPEGAEIKAKGRALFEKVMLEIDDAQADLLNELLDKIRK